MPGRLASRGWQVLTERPRLADIEKISLKQAARILGVDAETVRTYCRNGHLSFIQLLPGSPILLLKPEVEAFLLAGFHPRKSNGKPAPKPPPKPKYSQFVPEQGSQT